VRTQFSAVSTLISELVKKPAMNLVGPQVRKWRLKKGWAQEKLAAKLQLRGWNISRDSLASLELQRRRVPDCEMLYLARVLGVRLEDLFPKQLPMNKLGAQFQSGGKLAIFPTRSEQ
jgi:transcriptional regulator with XRE-family HTH domain